MRRSPLMLAGIWLLAGTQAPAQTPPETKDAPEPARPSLRAERITGAPPILDGRLDDEVWAGAEVSSDLVQREPKEGVPASERTEVRILYDDAAVYVGIRLFDSRPDSVVAQLARRDNQIYSDWVHVGFDSYHDRRTAFVFGVNPRGVKQDLMVFDDRRLDATWDAVWEVGTTIDSLGWTAEFRIPLSQLRFTPREGEQLWGFQVRRRIARRNELAFWAPLPRNAPGDVSLYGTLRGLGGLRSPRRLEVVPYSVARVTRAPRQAANPLYSPSDYFGSLGADLKYGLTSNLTLSATMNPDFGQVEADPSQVNLTAFETRFEERRPLFMEGGDIFRFGLGEGWWGGEQLFYSRRIGRAPQRRPFVAGGFAEVPDATTLLGAVKLSGKTASGWSIGVLDVATAEEQALTVDSLGRRGREVVEPMSNYAVARLKRDFRTGQSAIGGIFTATNRRLDDNPALGFLRSSAYVGGLDARHRFGGGNYELKGWLMGSHVRGSEEAITRTQRSSVRYFQRPDAAHLDLDPSLTSLSGVAAGAAAWKIGGGNWRGAVDVLVRSPGFETNDLGFQRLADRVSESAFVAYEQFRPGRRFRRWRVDAFEWSQWSYGGERVETAVGGTANFQLLNYWGGHGGAEYYVEALSTDALRGGPALRTPGKLHTWLGLNSDQRRRVSGGLFADLFLEDETDGLSFQLGPTLAYRPSARMELSLGPSAAWNVVPWQYVAERQAGGKPRYVVGRLDQQTASLTARLNYTFTPDLTLQLYAQPFISAGEFTEFQVADAPRAGRLAERFRRLGEGELVRDPTNRAYRVDLDGNGAADFSFPDRDFHFKEMRSNAVLRWEYRPGSALFVVWSQGRSASDPDGGLRLARDARRLLSVEETNVLLVKLSYWLSR
ncbi:MAG TPA: DUF5916 domain-containing protein [Longimicrobiaceae bacterium]|nr:DUF5916 domain-containing protein [Longimicrobiaceae bacterium]